MLLTGLFLLAFSVYFPIHSRTIYPGVAPSTVVWTLPHQSLINKMPHRFAYRLVLWKIFFNSSLLFSNHCRLCQVGIKLTRGNVNLKKKLRFYLSPIWIAKVNKTKQNKKSTTNAGEKGPSFTLGEITNWSNPSGISVENPVKDKCKSIIGSSYTPSWYMSKGLNILFHK